MSDAGGRARLTRILRSTLHPSQWLEAWRSTRPSAQPKKPGELVYGIDDVPPPLFTVFSGFQHVGLVRIQLIFPALVIQLAELPTEDSVNMLSLSLIALGVAAILQSLPRGPVGSRFLCPPCHDAIFLEPSIAALKFGGLPLVFGMTMVAGVIQSLLSPILNRIRPLLPPRSAASSSFWSARALPRLVAAT